MTRRVNLIPHQITVGRRAARVVGVWAVVAVCASTAAGLFCGWTWLTARSALGGLSVRLDEATKAAAEAGAPMAGLETRADLLRRQIAVADRLRARADWSAMLALLNTARGTEVVLESVEIAPATPGTEIDRVGTYAVTVQGVADSAAAVLAYATRLQDSDVFDTLPAPRTGERTFAGKQRIGFQISGEIGRTPSAPRAEARP